jgi:biofilm PGA synthesis N-glycosyltransferase PgaC
MQVPSIIYYMLAQRKRWARGQGEVLHAHLREAFRWRNHRMWLLSLESVASLIWVCCLLGSLLLTVVNVAFGRHVEFIGAGLAWGVAVSIIAMVQLLVALALRYPYDHWDIRPMLLGPIYPMLFWMVSASAAIDQQITALIHGPRERRVVWDIPREPLDSTSP